MLLSLYVNGESDELIDHVNRLQFRMDDMDHQCMGKKERFQCSDILNNVELMDANKR